MNAVADHDHDHGPDPDAVEPATGKVLGQVGKATPDDVDTAALRAVEAQRSWAALPFEERAAVLRRAGDALIANTEEIKGWLAQEPGAIRPFGDFQVRAAALRFATCPPIRSEPRVDCRLVVFSIAGKQRQVDTRRAAVLRGRVFRGSSVVAAGTGSWSGADSSTRRMSSSGGG